MTLEQVDAALTDNEVNGKAISSLRELSFSLGLKFANEIYLIRHFNSTAGDDLRVIASELEKSTGSRSIHKTNPLPSPHATPGHLSHEARIRKVAASYQAAELSLAAAESLLPKRVRTVDGKSFWDRFSDAIDQRSAEGEKALVDLMSRKR